MNNTANDNYIEVVIKREYEDADNADEDLILPDIDYLNCTQIKKEEPATSSTKRNNNVIILDKNTFAEEEDRDDLQSDASGNFIVYEFNDRNMREKGQVTSASPAITIQRCNKSLNVIKQLSKQSTLTAENSAAITIAATNTTIAAARATTASTANTTVTGARATTNIITAETAKLIAKPTSGIIMIEQIKPQLQTQPVVTNRIVTLSREQLRRFKVAPSVSNRPFRVAKKPLIANTNSNNKNTEVQSNCKTNTELKLKCMCRLKPTASPSESNANKLQLKEFFEKMFNETCKLNAQQRRIVQTSLLTAVCQAEEDVEAGKYCEKCYAN